MLALTTKQTNPFNVAAARCRMIDVSDLLFDRVCELANEMILSIAPVSWQRSSYAGLPLALPVMGVVDREGMLICMPGDTSVTAMVSPLVAAMAINFHAAEYLYLEPRANHAFLKGYKSDVMRLALMRASAELSPRDYMDIKEVFGVDW